MRVPVGGSETQKTCELPRLVPGEPVPRPQTALESVLVSSAIERERLKATSPLHRSAGPGSGRMEGCKDGC
jgi:hypothetical protein